MTTADHVIVLTTFPADGEATAVAETLIAERLAACVNVLPEMVSVYRWRGEVERERERQLVIKTTGRQVPRLQDRLRELHPYDEPEFVVVAIADGSVGYLRWLRDSTTEGP